MMTNLPDRFWDKVAADPNTGCWHWMAGTNPRGYGKFSLDGETLYAHRLSYVDAKGPVPEGLELDHRCRIKSCCNPNHLEAVTHRENVRRGEAGASTARRNAAKTHCPQGHPYSGDNLYIQASNGGRMCKECKRQRNRRHYAAKKEATA